MLYTGPDDIPGSDDHEGYVSGRTATGDDTGIWTDVRDGGPYTAYRAACECGWRDEVSVPPGPDGHRQALAGFVQRHFGPVTGRRGLDPERDFMPAWGGRTESMAGSLRTG